MPQINRIRINNVKYNFGTQFYDDFIMRFSCKNTIYDLANGGGKSLLMLLILQNLIPNCTLDEKQPIEKLFRANGGNTTIHSLVEWKLDPCYMKDNYKYMTTGFCARKAKSGGSDEGEETLGTTSSGAGSSESAIGGTRDTASIEYFNYVIFYREFGDNDIRNLPLSNGQERITYGGLKTYLRDLEKKDFGISVRIFERKGDYQSFISRYGLYESEWQIVCGINKTEGHVRTYFETNYKTSRKVVEDLLVEEIIQKSFHNRLGVENDEGQMAQTLLDIKDKLVELSKKQGEMNNYDYQVQIMNELSKQIEIFEDIYGKKEQLQNLLFNMLISCKINKRSKEADFNQLVNEFDRIKSEVTSEQRLISTAQVIEEQNSLNSMKVTIGDTLSKKDKLVNSNTQLKEKLLNFESANDYKDYLEATKKSEEIKETIHNRLRNFDDITRELKFIAVVKNERDKIELGKLQEKLTEANENLLDAQSYVTEIESSEREYDRKIAVYESKVEGIQQEIEKDEEAIKSLMDESMILIPENAQDTLQDNLINLEQVRKKLQAYEKEYEAFIYKLDLCKNELNKTEVSMDILKEQLGLLQLDSQKNINVQQRVDTIARVYNESNSSVLLNIISNTYQNTLQDAIKIEAKLKTLKEYEENLINGRYVCTGEQYLQVKEYLERHYGDEVVDGQTWFGNLNAGQKRDVIKRAPFVQYAFIIKNDFERIKSDTTLQSFNHSSYVVPIMSENILYDTKLEVNSELVTFATKNLDFLKDEAKLQTELKSIKEEIDHSDHKLAKLKERAQLIWEDYEFILGNFGDSSEHDRKSEQKLKDLNEKIQKLEHSREKLDLQKQNLMNQCSDLKSTINQENTKIKEIEKLNLQLEKVMNYNSRLNENYLKLNKCKEGTKESILLFNQLKEQIQEAKNSYEIKKVKANLLKEEESKIKIQWETIYAPYYSDSVNLSEANEYSKLTADQLESKFLGLKAVVEKETSDISDKEQLMNTYKATMEKSKDNIKYRGLEFEIIEKMFQNKELYASTSEELLEIKKKIKDYETQILQLDKELEAQNALMNRIDGSIAHGTLQIEERYGYFEAFTCDNPHSFIEQHKILLKKLNDNVKSMEISMKTSENKLKEILIIERDLERIVKNSGLSIPQNLDILGEADQQLTADNRLNFDDYEKVQKEFEAVIRLEYKRKEDFQKKKAEFVDKLNKLKAFELAQEVANSVNAPSSVEEAKLLIQNISETNTYILLEKDRIAKGIEDMEKIKDNFENRCIQICSNIKTELDRLPNLSKITLEGDVISIIGLQIPYVKEEFYKDRMSSYINETVTGAESFKNAEDRLKFIRTRLTWKKLFSVIVTDMNSIRINLYKRERMKDQSRYLKYEEAVGSTGQSQGIYIQFLVAIINYISSINATSYENASLGKTIFIDNPFGAAKDIYIWEPIFKLLKTNHVQLIVPARGATPAITGRFEVNYILGQKMVNGKQQTVVVDYHSQIKGEEIEYKTMDYQQATLFDITN